MLNVFDNFENVRLFLKNKTNQKNAIKNAVQKCRKNGNKKEIILKNMPIISLNHATGSVHLEIFNYY